MFRTIGPVPSTPPIPTSILNWLLSCMFGRAVPVSSAESEGFAPPPIVAGSANVVKGRVLLRWGAGGDVGRVRAFNSAPQ